MSVLALSLLGLAAGLAAVGALRLRLWRAMRAAGVTTPDRLARPDRALVGVIVGIVGVAGPGRDGPLTSTVNHERCVWHRHTITNRQKLGRRRVVRASPDAFTLAGTTGRVTIVPRDMRVHRPRRRSDRYLPGLASEPFPAVEALMGANAAQYRHREWVIFPDTPLYVLGHVTVHGGRIVVRRPSRGPHIISTLPAGQLANRTRTAAIAGFTGAGLALIGAALTLIAG